MDARTRSKLDALYVEYAKKLPGRIDSINDRWRQLSRRFTASGLQDLHRLVHGLCGSSGTYGYHELSSASRRLEVYLKSLLNQTEMSLDEIKRTTELLDAMTDVFLASSKSRLHESLPKEAAVLKQNKLVYILEQKDRFVEEVKKNLDLMGYDVVLFDDFQSFNEAVKKIIPGAVIADTERFSEEEISVLQALHQRDAPVPLFCISSSGDLSTRLKAIRAGGEAFFLKSNEAFYLTKTLDQICGSSANEPLRILIVDDSLSLAEYYSIILQEAGMEAHYITNPLDMLNVLNDFRPDLLLLDIYMPGCSGLELAAALRQEPIYAGIPIIFLSTEEDRFKQLAALNLGGDDFLTKPVLPQHLVAAVRSRAKRAGILSSYMTRDSLTGLLNHTNILQHLEIEVSRAKRLGSHLCFVMIDIDHFKTVNDMYGHATGDHVLRKLSGILLTRLRKTDLAGRYGGEEFAVILPNTAVPEAVALCREIRVLFSECLFRTEEGKELGVTLSAGIAAYPTLPDARQLIESADRALYQAKQGGRNREEVFGGGDYF
ncbi:MAG TPA: diguanylate cyclase [Gammaproteobacteria bacterium]|nr:diguanylate cyclase [Gammaproteobacteria bacterium]